MAVDWLADVRIYDADADESVVNKIVNYCGIALQSRDGQLVAMADPKECETVRENFLKKKLGLTQSDAVLDEAIQSVREVMKADRTKNRVTVYYLLTKHFGSLNLFGGVAGAAAGAAGLAAAAAGAFSGDDKDEGASVAPLAAAAGIAGAGVAAVTGAAASAGAAVSNAASGAADLASDAASSVADTVSGVAGSVRDTVAAPLAAVGAGYDDDNSGGGFGWLKWLLLAALLAALLFFLLKSCSGQEATPVADTETTEAASTEEAPEAVATAETAVAAPAGAGVAAGERNGKPMLTVYFDTGKSDVTADLAAAAAKVKAYVADNAGAKLGVSGFNDPTGNAAANAELSKKRAQAVGKALEAAGIPAASIEMVKPAESTDTKVDNTAARRVEVVVQ
ncbi:MAG: DUF2853 family protein [Sphingorhabdus sp.]